jgi:hypothetical protein
MSKEAPAKAVSGNGAAAKQAEQAARPPLVVKADACQLGEYARSTWEVTLPPGSVPEDLLARDALGVIAQQCRIKDLIYAQPSDGAWLAVYRVMAVDVASLQLALLVKYELPARAHHGQQDPEGFEISCDDVHGWFIRRKADGVLLGEQRTNPDLRNPEACRRYIFDHPTVRGPRAPVYS